MVVQSQELRPGMTVEVDKTPYQVIEYNHIKVARGGAVIRVKLRNLLTSRVLEKTFNSGEKLPRAHIDRRQMQYLYKAKDDFFFMDQESFEQISLDEEHLGDSKNFIKENFIVSILYYDNAPIGVELPASVTLKVIHTEPGVRGDTASGSGTKPATMETGFEMRVPLFINIDDTIKVDTRSGQYIERMK